MATQTAFLDRKSAPHIATLIALASISALAMNIYLPSLPSLAVHFDTTPAVMGLSVGIYLAASAIMQIFAGPISDSVGRRPVVLGGLVVFCIATLACIYAPSAQLFLAARALQAAAAICMVLSRAIVRDTVPAERAGSAIAYVTMGMAIVPMLGPAIGGFLEQSFGWQASFWALFIVGLLILLLSWADQGETAPMRTGGMRNQLREYPELLSSPRFWGYCFASALASGSFFAYLGGAPFVGTEVFGLSPKQLGLYFGAPAAGYFLGNFLSGRFSARIGINKMVITGVLITSSGPLCLLVLFAMDAGGVNVFFAFMALVGLGNGMTIPNATAGMLSVRPHLAGTASGLGGAIMIGGGAALSALAGASLGPNTGPAPLLWIMFLSALLGVVSILSVILRERRLGT